jgi:murein DD-endopeptidase MepM/ murein hydrolase activator NlpD
MRLFHSLTALVTAAMLITASCVRSGAAESADSAGTAGLTTAAAGADSTALNGIPPEYAAVTGSPADLTKTAGLHFDSATGTANTADNRNSLFGIPLDSYNIVTGKVKRNQFISSILSDQGVDWNDIEKLLSDNRETFDPRRVRTGSSYSVLMTADTLNKPHYFIYHHDPRVAYVFSLKDTLAIYRHDAEIRKTLRYSSGTINTSLWDAAQENDLNPNLSAELSEIYAWTIDFFGLQKGDRFKVIYEEEFIGDESVGIRRIHAAQFEHAGSTIYAIPFIQDSVMSFFDTTGASLRKAFLKAPLRYSRISSRFSGGRLHPILKIVRPHHGVDYAAPIGTPVLAIGDGRVTSTAYEGGAGRTVKIKHNSVYSTAYLHLSRFGPGISSGVYVKQGQVIGYVGSSGLSTGPHLDFRFYRNGSPIDPLKVEAPPVNPVAPEALREFEKVAEGYINLLGTISY